MQIKSMNNIHIFVFRRMKQVGRILSKLDLDFFL